MSAPLNPGASSACCAPQCTDVPFNQVPGPPGNDGNNGNNGNDGQNAFTLTAANFTVPAIAANVAVTVANSNWAANGQKVFVATAGYYEVAGIPDSTHLTLKNLGYTGNAAPAAVITAPQAVSPGGIKGTDGSAPSVTLDDLSPTTSKGDLLVDNGANNPNASVVRHAVGSNGKAVVADSTQPDGINYATITPNSAANDNNIPRFDGTTGTPMPLQDSKMLITDDGALQSTPTGGNARGSKAVDLQVERSAVDQVASGSKSVIDGGSNNKASGASSVVGGGSGNIAGGANSTVAGGASNSAGGTESAVAGGASNSASNANSTVAGGTGNTASGSISTIGGGSANTASATGSVVSGGASNTANKDYATVSGGTAGTAYLKAMEAYGIATGYQRSKILAKAATTDATATSLTALGDLLVLSTNASWAFTGTVLGRSSAGVSGFYLVSGGIKNIAGVVTLIGAVTVAVAVADGGWPGGASVTITADGVGLALKIEVVGALATNINWLANLDVTEVTF